ncbi:nucleic-acid-binding protein from transposon X-element [Trichonephila clavipes]|nr:nucleic-acid-binding protein from transposon X-element [Trichonephila clavipes]
MEKPTEMELVNASLPSSRSSTPSLTNCERRQLVNQDLKKFSIMLSNVSHTIECIAPITSDDDPDLAALYSRQAYLDERQQQALGELSSLPRCDTPGCRVHSTPCNSPTKKITEEFPELPKKISSKRKESADCFISPTAKQTFKRLQVEFRNFEIDVNNRFEKINENDENIAGTSQNAINFAPSKTTETDKTNSLPPPVFLNLEDNYMEQLKTLNEIIPTLSSKKTGTLIKLYTNNSHDYELLQDSVEKLKYQFFTIKPKHERPIKVVVKGLPKNTETRDIHENLIELGFTVDKVTQLVGKITKQPLPVFLINLPRNIHNLKIFHLTLLCYITVRVEGYDGKGVTQCYSCNKFHHTAENCHFTPRCLKCGEAHQTRECAIKKLEKTYCINCHVYGHMANYSKLLLYPKPRKGTNITPNNYATALDNLIRPNTSFAQAVSKSTINSRNPQQMAAPSNTRRNPAIFSQKRTNQIVTPTPTNNNITNENNSPQNIILQTLQQTIQALTLLTQQVSNLNFNNPAPKPKKNKSKLTKKELQALLEALIDDDDD